MILDLHLNCQPFFFCHVVDHVIKRPGDNLNYGFTCETSRESSGADKGEEDESKVPCVPTVTSRSTAKEFVKGGSTDGAQV